MKFDLKRSCNDCPFRVNSLAGWLGGHEPLEVVSAVIQDIAWPCHQTHEGGDFQVIRESPTVQHCAGSAMFAANIAKLSRDKEVAAHQRLLGRSAGVFQSVGEFLKHHSIVKVNH